MSIDFSKEKAINGLEKYQDEFLQDRLSELKIVTESIKIENYEKIQKFAHKWKSYSSPYGFNHLETLSRTLENVILEKDKDEASKIIKNIDEYLSIKSKNLEN